MTTLPPTEKETWEDAFKTLYYREFDEIGYVAVDTTYEDVKAFIRKTREQARQEEREWFARIVEGFEAFGSPIGKNEQAEAVNIVYREYVKPAFINALSPIPPHTNEHES